MPKNLLMEFILIFSPNMVKIKKILVKIFKKYFLEYIKSTAFNRHNYFYVVRQDDDISAVIEMAMKNDVPPPGANIFNARLGNIPQIHVRACNIDTCQGIF